MAILIIAILSMVLTPADPISMLLMMFPLIGLYEVGILMIRNSPTRQETAESAAE
jgi:sec-independent protein translocase protein TatC